MFKNTSVSFSKEEMLSILMEAYNAGVCSYVDICEQECLRIWNNKLTDKIKNETNSLNIGVLVDNKPVETVNLSNWDNYDYFSNNIYTTFTSR